MTPSANRRQSAVAGQFYPEEPAALERELGRALNFPAAGERAFAVVVPHAGYVYSGFVAGQTYRQVALTSRIVLLGVNHMAVGAPVATWDDGQWMTPLGPVSIDAELVAAIRRRAPFLENDPSAHAREHSLEVQLPFLQYLAGEESASLRVAPICIASHELDTLADLGEAIAGAIEETGESILIIASTDMTHYEDAATASDLDAPALERILAVDGPGLLECVIRDRISMCGVAPTTVALVASRALGARHAKLIRYATSGDVTGDNSSVVAYAGLVIQ